MAIRLQRQQQQQQPKKRRITMMTTTTPIMMSALLIVAYISPTAATSCHIISARPAFYPNNIMTSSVSQGNTIQSSTTSAHKRSRRMHIGSGTKSKSNAAIRDIQNVGWRKKAKSKLIDLDDNFDYNYNQQQSSSAIQLQQQQQQPPSLEELRAQLGPIGLLVSNTIELTLVTLGSYISGGMLGYLGGSVMNIPSTLFGKSMGSISQRLSALNSKAFATMKTWGQLSAAFSGFNNFVRLCRGDVDDGWNTVFGSALTGAFLSRGGGTQAMLQGALTYAGFTYFLDKMTRSPSSQTSQQTLMYNDVPVDEFE